MPLRFANGTVWNKREKNVPADAVYIGRGGPNNGYFGNPFTHLTTPTAAEFKVKTREEAIKAFEVYARGSVSMNEEYKTAVAMLHGKDLVCWCAPQDCHGRILLTIAKDLNELQSPAAPGDSS